MRKAFVIALLLATAGCGSQPRQERSEDLRTMDAAEPPPAASADSSARAPAAPGIAPTAAPGVAFNYRYAFRLAGERIAGMQEQHAAACEKLGIARCRITGMRYRLVGNRDIEAMLAFKLDPAIARAFGKQGIDAVTQAEGMLVDAEITGEDAGARIAAATRSEGQLADDLKRVEEQLARAGLRSAERAELQIQAQQLREQIRATHSEKQTQQESLATTPMVFNYGTGDLVPGFDGRPRVKQALQNALDNLAGGVIWIFVALITLLPWLALLALGIWAWRRWGRRASPAPAAVTPAEA
ncbi:MAG: DUF4349 domain-containing protein [Alphaproteobacteria bacterium]|nr:DUF4349 domain-containing protein [Alphaproteobacteria bacterium]MBV9370727.1 DUF4349 domain-containing protein [Alphaproteobacteria bacterium]MBV9899800.1 DUF4349 domain-containing protein [Alphaproteobacteria bacterium]